MKRALPTRPARRPRSAPRATLAAVCVYGLLALLCNPAAAAQDPNVARPAAAAAVVEKNTHAADGKAAPAATAATTSTPAAASTGEAAPLSEAEQAVQLQRSIAGDEKRLKELKALVAAPDGEYPQAEKEFNRLDGQWTQKKDALELAKEKERPDEAARLEAEIAKLVPLRAEALQRYELALKERKLLQGNIQTLEEKIAKNKQSLEKITTVAPTSTDSGGAASPAPPSSGASPKPPGGGVGSATSKPAGSDSGPKAASTVSSGDGGGKAKQPDAADLAKAAAGIPPNLPTAAAAPEKEPKRKEVVEAEASLKAREQEAQQAEQDAHELADRIALLQKNLEVERELKATLERRTAVALESLNSLRSERVRATASGAPLGDLPQKIAQAEQRYAEVQNDGRRLESNVRRLEDELQVVLQQRGVSAQAAETKRQAADAERRRLEWLTNPFALPTVWNWMRDRGPRVVGILALIAFLAWVSRLARGLVGRVLAQRGLRGTKDERENRSKTIMGVFHNAASLVVYGLGAVLLLEEAGISVAPLVGGVAVVGVAVAFGAQNLIKDYFSGFMILLEQQYLVNDIVKIGALSGQVESISLRMTCLRDTDGSVHFIPHGQITQVTNLTHGWSRAVIDVSIGLRDDVDRALDLLRKIAAELRLDDKYGRLILEDADVQGVQDIVDDHVKLRLLIKTRPLQQWAVRREFLRRIKKRFDLEGIACPTPVGVPSPEHLPPAEGAAAAAAPAADHVPPCTARQGVKASV